MKPAKPNAAAIVSVNAQRDWRREMAKFLETLQESYRTEISDGEAELWMEMLSGYAFPEIKAAAMDLMRHPPKQQLDDGTTQTWTGMPKVQDLLAAIEEKRQQQAALKRQQEQSREMDELRKRREAGEEFFTIADVVDDFAKQKPELYEKHRGTLQAIKRAVETGDAKRSGIAQALREPLTDEQLDQRREELRRQAAEVLNKNKASEG